MRAWSYFKDSELQAFPEHCCWGNERRWGDSPDSQSEELKTLIDLLFKPRLLAESRLVRRQIGHSGKLNTPTDCTRQWLNNLESQWLPIHQCMGLRLAGTLPRRADCTYWQLQVMYHSPLAMQTGTLGPQDLVVGGGMGMRYIITGSTIVEHGSSDGPLLSDRYSTIAVSLGLLQPKDAT